MTLFRRVIIVEGKMQKINSLDLKVLNMEENEADNIYQELLNLDNSSFIFKEIKINEDKPQDPILKLMNNYIAGWLGDSWTTAYKININGKEYYLCDILDHGGWSACHRYYLIRVEKTKKEVMAFKNVLFSGAYCPPRDVLIKLRDPYYQYSVQYVQNGSMDDLGLASGCLAGITLKKRF